MKVIYYYMTVIILLLVLIAANAIWAGYSFMSDSSGGGMGISSEYLRHSPFNNFFMPGMILFFFNGVLNIIALILLLIKYRKRFYVICFQGAVLLGWIVVQIIMLQEFNQLHYLMMVSGVALMLMASAFIKTGMR